MKIPDGTGNRSTVVHHSVCRLFNASYDVNFVFEAGNQTIQRNADLDVLNEIQYPVDDPFTPTNYAAHSYTAFMWVLTDQLVGSMGFWIDNTTHRKFSSISTPIEHNSLLGSVDLDPFFDYNDALYRQNSSTANKSMSDHEIEDFYNRWEDRYRGPGNAHRPAIASFVRDIKTLRFSQKDMEFIQYHPTGLPGTGILITEAARGEGGIMVNKDGYRYLQDYNLGKPLDINDSKHPVKKSMELGPRDRLSQAFVGEMEKGREI